MLRRSAATFLLLLGVFALVSLSIGDVRAEDDTTAPELTVPADMTVPATSPDGATVEFAATATDAVDPAPVVACDPSSGSVFPVGETTVTCTASDAAGNVSEPQSFTVTVTSDAADTTGPQLTLPSDLTVEATSPDGAVVEFSATATDDTDPAPVVTCAPASGAVFAIGATTVSCSARDAAGNVTEGSFTVTVTVTPAGDTTAPQLSVPADIAAVATSPAGATVTFTTSATDDVDPAPTVSCAPPSGSAFPVGTTTVTCTARDAAGNESAPKTFTVTVAAADTTPPDLDVPADLVVGATSEAGARVVYAVDARDAGGGSVAVTCTPPPGATFPFGATTVTCMARDAAGNTTTKTFTVTVRDEVAPFLSVPETIVVDATSRAGAVVWFDATARDDFDSSPAVACDPPTGSMFRVGTTTVSCSAADNSGNASRGSFAVIVRDGTSPVLELPENRVVEANGPRGATVQFTVRATDAVDGPLPPTAVTCVPVSGATFAMGTTRVFCGAKDSEGNTGVGSFSVTVQDRTAPVLTVPADIEVAASSNEGAPASHARISAFLRGAVATDIVDQAPVVTNNAPAVFPIGQTDVTFTARDASANAASRRATVTVRAPGTPASPQTEASAPEASDRVPPGNVKKLVSRPGDRRVTLQWESPGDPDFLHVVVTRLENGAANGASAEKAVYTGNKQSFTDRGVRNGVEYRYVVVSYDRAGNRSAGVATVALPKARPLTAPTDGARVTAPPTLTWRAVGGATYYNVQLYRGTEKILSAWPSQPRLRLGLRWKFRGYSRQLSPGRYRWYVWPGVGPRAQAKYGDLLGQSHFTVLATKGKRR